MVKNTGSPCVFKAHMCLPRLRFTACVNVFWLYVFEVPSLQNAYLKYDLTRCLFIRLYFLLFRQRVSPSLSL
ncbi:hypothetical protein RJT34_13468 [Clitoria ternatea]|uniref:Uncharacterized protein n=1 Tax=Clitoria ternatea TaxID=43366 RepID=A0AAN9JQP5_CLITE